MLFNLAVSVVVCEDHSDMTVIVAQLTLFKKGRAHSLIEVCDSSLPYPHPQVYSHIPRGEGAEPDGLSAQ